MTPYERGYADAEEEISGAYELILSEMATAYNDIVIQQQRNFDVTCNAVSYDRGCHATAWQVKSNYVTLSNKEFKKWLTALK